MLITLRAYVHARLRSPLPAAMLKSIRKHDVTLAALYLYVTSTLLFLTH